MKAEAALARIDAGLAVECRGPVLVARFGVPQRFLGWALAGGGRSRGRTVAFVHVKDDELRPPVDPRALLLDRLREAGVPGAVGLMTSRDLGAHVRVERRGRDFAAGCVATVGMGNALRAGDPPTFPRVGTINLLCHVGAPLGEEALVEALSIAVEARTVAVLEAGLASVVSGAPASGTGTDCVVIAAPESSPELPYAGKHTEVGHLVGAAVLEAVGRGIAEWKRAQPAGGEKR